MGFFKITMHFCHEDFCSHFANSSGPDEMPHNAAFHQGLYCFPSLGPVVNIFAIFSNAKNKRIKIYHIKGIGYPLLTLINIVIFHQETEK